MNNTLGKNVKVTLFGESHGKYIGAVVDGLPAGIPVDEERIASALSSRRPHGNISTSRCEADEYTIASGTFRGFTCGTPLCIIIPNADTKSADYDGTARPGHADFTSHVRNAGFEDYRGGGHFSGRLTAALVAAGAVVRGALEAKGIFIGTHIASIGGVFDRPFCNTVEDVKSVKDSPFPVLDPEAGEAMKKIIEDAKSDGDSVGGVLECAVCGIPAGVGEPWFDSAESAISHAVFSVPAVKGVEFGAGFALAAMRGSEANDPFVIKDGGIATETNNCGGILGGLTTGGDVVFRAAVKPTPTIFKKQKTVDLSSGCETETSQTGRHDPCVVHRAASVVTAVTAFAVADMLVSRYGEEYLRP